MAMDTIQLRANSPTMRVAKQAEVAIERVDQVPEGAFGMQSSGQQSQRLNPAHREGDDDRYRGNGDVVVELADRLDIGPAVGAQHQDVVG